MGRTATKTSDASLLPNRAPRQRAAFTLTELVIVILIIAAVMGLTWPVLGAMRRTERVDTAVSRIDAAMASLKAMLPDHRMADGKDVVPQIPQADYSGVMLVVEQTQLRFANNRQNAKDSADRYIESRGGEAYQILDIYEPVSLPLDVGLALLVKRNPDNPSDDVLALIPPPFALCVDANGYPRPPYVDPAAPALAARPPGTGFFQRLQVDLNRNGRFGEAGEWLEGGMAAVVVFDPARVNERLPGGITTNTVDAQGRLVMNLRQVLDAGGRVLRFSLQGGSVLR